MIRTIILLTLVIFIISCNNNTASLNSKQASAIKDSVQLMTESIAKNVSLEGPVAWLRYFEDDPGFFMASEGQLVFPDNESAKNFINNSLAKSIRKIELRWSNIRIDPLTTKLAGIAATFHEDIIDSAGRKFPEDGYFTGLAHQSSQGWKLRNAHWSTTVQH